MSETMRERILSLTEGIYSAGLVEGDKFAGYSKLTRADLARTKAVAEILATFDTLVAERDAALAKLSDPRIEAWRALDAETRWQVLDGLSALRAASVERVVESDREGLRIAAAALAALTEKA